MTKHYEHGTETATYEELAKAARRTPRPPITIDGAQTHGLPLRDGRRVVGTVHLEPCPHRRGLQGKWHFHKESTPEWVIDAIKRGETLPVSPFFYADVQDGQQRDILFNRFAIMREGTPRCPPDRCGVGVADAMTKPKTEEKPKPDEKPEPEGTPVPKPVPEEQRGKLKETDPKDKPQDQVEQDPAETVAELRARLQEAEATVAKAEAEMKAARLPHEGLLAQHGITPDAISKMSLADLKVVAASLQRSATEGLPGATPAPAPAAPKTEAEAKAERESKFHKDLEDKSKEEFKGW